MPKRWPVLSTLFIFMVTGLAAAPVLAGRVYVPGKALITSDVFPDVDGEEGYGHRDTLQLRQCYPDGAHLGQCDPTLVQSSAAAYALVWNESVGDPGTWVDFKFLVRGVSAFEEPFELTCGCNLNPGVCCFSQRAQVEAWDWGESRWEPLGRCAACDYYDTAADELLNGFYAAPSYAKPLGAGSYLAVVRIKWLIQECKSDWWERVANTFHIHYVGVSWLLLPNLVVENVEGPSAAVPGQTVRVRVTTRNAGSANAGPSHTRVLLCARLVDCSECYAPAWEVARVAVPALAPDARYTQEVSWTVPTGVASGTYYWNARADADDEVDEGTLGEWGGGCGNAVVVAPCTLSPERVTFKPCKGESAEFTYCISDKALVKLTVRDVNWQWVRGLVWDWKDPGCYTVQWNGRDQQGNLVPEGWYRACLSVKNAAGQTCNKTAFIKVECDPPSCAIDSMCSTFRPQAGETCRIVYHFNDDGAATCKVKLSIYRYEDSALVRDLIVDWKTPGAYAVDWNGRDASGNLSPAGYYLAYLVVWDQAGLRCISSKCCFRVIRP